MQIKVKKYDKKSRVKRLVESCFVNENIKLGKKLVQQNKLSESDLQTLVSIDPTDSKKYVGWLTKIWVTENPNIDDLRNTIEEFNTLLNKGKTKIKDIYTVKSFTDLQKEVSEINQTGDNISVKDLEEDYETIIDNQDLLIITPHTHEASRKLGLTKFAYRKCEGGKDSAWCTTYKAPDHFNDYYYSKHVTFYYILVRSKRLRDELVLAFGNRAARMTVTALVVSPNGKIDGYDGLDNKISPEVISKFREIINI